ncbi:MAG: carboxypeptidase-like regulatory domain-containing protein, partial [Terriglobia bacterium]
MIARINANMHWLFSFPMSFSNGSSKIALPMPYRLIGAMIFSVLLCPTARAQMSRPASLAVTLRDANGKPAPGAAMTLHEVATGRQFKSVSDASGVCTYAGIPAGAYWLSVRWRGLAAASSRKIQITSGKRLRLWGSISNGAELELRWPKITQE